MKSLLKKIISSTGYEIKKIQKPAPATDSRPIGNIKHLFEDLRARGLRCNTVLDIGANGAVWSRMAKSVFHEANFFLVEPQIEMKEKLENFCSEFKGSGYKLAGAGAEKGELTLTVWDDLAGSSLLPQENNDLLEKGKQRKIEIITIDDLISENVIPVPELVKLDIQGFELEALKGATKIFGKSEVILLEVSFMSFSDVPGMPEFAEVISFMYERGYVAYDLPGFLRRPLDGALGQCDVCFVKDDSFLRKSKDWN